MCIYVCIKIYWFLIDFLLECQKYAYQLNDCQTWVNGNVESCSRFATMCFNMSTLLRQSWRLQSYFWRDVCPSHHGNRQFDPSVSRTPSFCWRASECFAHADYNNVKTTKTRKISPSSHFVTIDFFRICTWEWVGWGKLLGMYVGHVSRGSRAVFDGRWDETIVQNRSYK